jgi:hypothetical protein
MQGQSLAFCIRTTHHLFDDTLNFKSPTAKQECSMRLAIGFGESHRWP